MEKITLQAEIRKHTGKKKANEIRRDGLIPAIAYGEGIEPVSLSLKSKDVLKILHTQEARHAIINLEILSDGKKRQETVVIKEFQHNPVNGHPLHIDFNIISLKKAITLNVAVAAKGVPVGVKENEGILASPLWELKIECLARDVPKNIEVDVSNMRIGDCVHVKDIVLPSGIKILNDPDAVVFYVEPPAVEKPLEEKPEAAQAEPEVIKQKKPEETEEGEKK